MKVRASISKFKDVIEDREPIDKFSFVLKLGIFGGKGADKRSHLILSVRKLEDFRLYQELSYLPKSHEILACRSNKWPHQA